jgi:hypothetical protein
MEEGAGTSRSQNKIIPQVWLDVDTGIEGYLGTVWALGLRKSMKSLIELT